jgi:hypothetical protein
VSFDRYPYSDIYSILQLYIELGWSKKRETELKTYSDLLITIQMVQEDIDNIITTIVCNDKNLKRFLMMHSAFNSNISAHDSLERLMIRLLQPNKSDHEWFIKEPEVPKELLQKLVVFNPEPWRDIKDNIVITYKMWGNYQQGEQTEPIQILDTDWEKIQKEANALVASIKQHEVIDIPKIIEEDELPF